MATNPVLAFPFCHRFHAHAFHDLETAPFDTAAYSRLKFGDGQAAKAMGREMADRFLAEHSSVFDSTVVLIPAPSSAVVPAASTLLAQHMMERLNVVLARQGRHPTEWTALHRSTSYYDNYAHLPKEVRQKLLAQDTVYINRAFIAGKTLLFIDDCNITGTHEDKIEQFLVGEGIDNPRAYVCYAKYRGDDAAIEGRLNAVAIADAYDLIALAQQPGFVMTTRAMRMFLEHPVDDLDNLVRAASPTLLEQVHHGAIVRGYHVHPTFAEAFARLDTLVPQG